MKFAARPTYNGTNILNETEIAALLAGYATTGHNHDTTYGRLAVANTWTQNQTINAWLGIGTAPSHVLHVATAGSQFAARNVRASWGVNTAGGWARAFTLENEYAGANAIAAFGAYGTAAGVDYTYLTITDKTTNETGYDLNLGIFLRSNGNVGMGTNNPAYQLDVASGLRARASVTAKQTGTFGEISLVSGSAALPGYIAWRLPGTDSAPGTRLGYMGWHATNIQLLLENNAEFAVTGATGSANTVVTVNNTSVSGIPRVAIGNATRYYDLRVDGSTGAFRLRDISAGNLDRISVLTDGSVKVPGSLRIDNVFYVSRGDSSVQSAFSAGNFLGLTIEAFNSGNTVKYPVVLAPWGGNVGVANLDPAMPLDISGRSRVRSTLALGTAGWWFSDISKNDRMFMGLHTDTSSPKGGIWNGGAWRLIVDAAGNVGVNRETPSGILHTWDGAGGMLHKTVTGVGTSEVEIIPDGTGDVAGGMSIRYIARGANGTTEGGHYELGNSGGDTSTITTNFLITLYASGKVAVQARTSTTTWRISFHILWT